MQTARLQYSERGERCVIVPSLWPANSSLISSQASLCSSTNFFSFSPAGSSLRIASSISFRAFDCREKASHSSRGLSGSGCSCCAIPELYIQLKAVFNGKDLRNLPIEKRKEELEELLKKPRDDPS